MKRGLVFTYFRACMFISLILVLMGSAALAEMPLPLTTAETIGFSQERFDRISALLKGDVDKGKLVGAVALIARNGKIGYLKTFGYQDKLAGKEMRKDAIFRLFSMSKPITSVALLMLYEEGKVDLFNPLEMYLPEFKDQKVALIGKGEDGKPAIIGTEPVKRKTTVLDIFRHTGGLTYGFTGHPVDKLYREKVTGGGDQTLAEFSAKLGPLPLMWQPGAIWHYSYSHDVQGRLIEVLSGMPFDKFLEERIFKPLGMKDTGFYFKEEDYDRVAHYAPVKDKETGKMAASPLEAGFMKPQKFLSGGGGMVSTASDYLRFASMLLNGGEFNGVRLLGPKTVAYMTSDHLGSIPQNDLYNSIGPGWGYGLGLGVRKTLGETPYAGSAGNHQWGGYAGTFYWVDPKEDMIGMMLFQAPGPRMHYRRTFKNLVYSAIID